MKVMITGGAGFIGYHLAERLSNEGNEVVIIDDFSRGVTDSYIRKLGDKNNVKLLHKNLLDDCVFSIIDTDYDQIYHLAAIIGVQNVLNRSYDVLTNNVILTMRAIEIANRQRRLKRFMFASTSEVYAGTLTYYGLNFPTEESTPLTVSEITHPRTSYMLSKIYGEALLRQSKIPYTIFRPHNLYGPRMGMSHVIPELLKKAYFDENNGKLDVYSAKHSRTFCYIDDAVEMLIRLTENDTTLGNVYNIGNEVPEVSMRNVAETILNVMEKNMEIIELPPSPGSPERRCPSMKKTNICTKYEPKISLEEGIKKTFEWYKKNIFDGSEVCEK